MRAVAVLSYHRRGSVTANAYRGEVHNTESASVGEWLPIVRAEYLEIPGLSLTKGQVQRLWNLEPETCEALLSVLVDVKFLKRTRFGAYVLADPDGILPRRA